MIVRDFADNDFESCRKLWLECFPDDADFCGYFFENVHPCGKAVVCEADGSAVSYLNILPFEADFSGQTANCGYIYGVSTAVKYRNRGFMRALLNRAHEISADDAFLFLIPSVKGIYEKFGYDTIAERCKTSVSLTGSDGKPCSDLNHLNMIYDEFRKKFGLSLRRNPKWWEFIYHTALSDGFTFIANDGAYAAVSGNEVCEIAYASEKYRDMLNIGNAVLTLPKVMARKNIGLNFDNSYIAMMLD